MVVMSMLLSNELYAAQQMRLFIGQQVRLNSGGDASFDDVFVGCTFDVYVR